MGRIGGRKQRKREVSKRGLSKGEISKEELSKGEIRDHEEAQRSELDKALRKALRGGNGEKHKVRAINLGREDVGDVETNEQLKLLAPVFLTAELLDAKTVRLTWDMLKPDTGNVEFDNAPIEYAVYRYTEQPAIKDGEDSDDDDVKPATIEISPSTTFTFTDLENNTRGDRPPTQYFRVKAANSVSISDFSQIIQVDLTCGLEVTDEESAREVAEKVNARYDTVTGMLTWNRIIGITVAENRIIGIDGVQVIHGYGVLVIAENYHQQFYLREKSDAISSRSTKSMDLSKIGATGIKGVLLFLINNCGSSIMIIPENV